MPPAQGPTAARPWGGRGTIPKEGASTKDRKAFDHHLKDAKGLGLLGNLTLAPAIAIQGCRKREHPIKSQTVTRQVRKE